jgi:rod shape-determining protein MreC
MKKALELLLQFGYHLLFLALQFICFYIIINYNKEQKSIFINSTSMLATSINGKVDKLNKYVLLQQENDSLQKQNARLIKKFIDYDINARQSSNDTLTVDSSKYELQAVDICNSTFNLKDNYITLCKGSNQGITEDAGIISQNGIVGIVKKVSANFSIVMSILHSQSNISCTIKRNLRKGISSTGVLTWKSNDPKICNLESIPKHLIVLQGDTIITSGYSTVFPRGLLVGKVKNVTLDKGSNSYSIDVELFNDPTTWDALYMIKNKLGSEQKTLENSILINE